MGVLQVYSKSVKLIVVYLASLFLQSLQAVLASFYPAFILALDIAVVRK